MSTATLPVTSLRRVASSPAWPSSVMNLRKSQASSGFFEPLEMPRPCEFGVAKSPGMCATPSVSGVTQLPCPLTKK